MQTNSDGNLTYVPVVVFDHPDSKEIHRELFHFEESVYVQANEDLTGFLSTFDIDAGSTIHIAGRWQTLLKLLTWNNTPSEDEALFALSTLLPPNDLSSGAFTAEGLFDKLLSGKEFAALRMLAYAAGDTARKHLKDKGTNVEFHLVSLRAGVIVSSSV